MRKLLLSTIFPFLVLNITLSDGLTLMGVFPVGVIFYWVALIIGFIVISITFKNAYFSVSLALTIITFSILNVIIENSIIFFISVLSKSTILILVSALTVIEYPKMLKWQMLFFLILSIPILILQILGVSETVQILNTLFYKYDEFGGAIRDLQLTDVLFKNKEDIVYNTAQARPPGLFHSNAILSPILLGIAAYLFSMSYTNKILLTDVLICIAIVLVMSKISVIAIFTILVMAKLSNRQFTKFKKLFFLLIIVYFTYWIFLPGYFVNNLNIDAFYFSSYYRLIDLYIFINDNPEVRDKYVNILSSEMGFNYLDESEIGGLSGITKVIKILPFIIIFLYLIRKSIFRLYRKFKVFSPKLFTLSKISMVTLTICTLATPLFKAPVFGYFAGFALLPFLYPIFKHKFDKLKTIV